VSSIKKYLINSKAQEFTVTSLRHYKLSRAYQHLDANHICNVSFNQLKHSSTFCAIKASCIPSQSGDEVKIKHVHVIMDKQTGEPYGGFCTCTVGLVYWKKQLCIEKIKYTFNKCSLHAVCESKFCGIIYQTLFYIDLTVHIQFFENLT